MGIALGFTTKLCTTSNLIRSVKFLDGYGYINTLGMVVLHKTITG